MNICDRHHFHKNIDGKAGLHNRNGQCVVMILKCSIQCSNKMIDGCFNLFNQLLHIIYIYILI